MSRIAFFFAILFLSASSLAGLSESVSSPLPVSKELKKDLAGTPVYIQIFKEEHILELYGKLGSEYRLLTSYPICKFSGGLGPKRHQGDFMSPEGFYDVTLKQLKPDSRFYRAINLGFPNQYDRAQGYDGNYLMIHGNCVSVGCYAMTNAYMDEIYHWVEAALRNGQPKVMVSIYPFRMTTNNMQRYRNSRYLHFWQQLQPGYVWFTEHHQPPDMIVSNGQYVLNTPPATEAKPVASDAFQRLSGMK